MTTNNIHWVSIWGNAVSIAENRPESYGKNITLRYPIYSHFAETLSVLLLIIIVERKLLPLIKQP